MIPLGGKGDTASGHREQWGRPDRRALRADGEDADEECRADRHPRVPEEAVRRPWHGRGPGGLTISSPAQARASSRAGCGGRGARRSPSAARVWSSSSSALHDEPWPVDFLPRGPRQTVSAPYAGIDTSSRHHSPGGCVRAAYLHSRGPERRSTLHACPFIGRRRTNQRSPWLGAGRGGHARLHARRVSFSRRRPARSLAALVAGLRQLAASFEPRRQHMTALRPGGADGHSSPERDRLRASCPRAAAKAAIAWPRSTTIPAAGARRPTAGQFPRR